MPDLEDEEEYEVDEAKDECKIQGEVHFLVKWKGWPSEYDQWVPEKDMTNAKQAINKFRKRRRL